MLVFSLTSKEKSSAVVTVGSHPAASLGQVSSWGGGVNFDELHKQVQTLPPIRLVRCRGRLLMRSKVAYQSNMRLLSAWFVSVVFFILNDPVIPPQDPGSSVMKSTIAVAAVDCVNTFYLAHFHTVVRPAVTGKAPDYIEASTNGLNGWCILNGSFSNVYVP